MAHRINFNDYLYLQGHNVQITGTEGLRVPMGNASERPITMKGVMRYNPDEDQYELGTDNDILILNNRNDQTVWYSKKGGDLDGTLVIKNHRILNNVGSAFEPSYSFYYYNNTGLYSPSSNNISVILEGDKNITPIIEMVREDNSDFGQTFTINGDLVVNGEQKVKDTSDIKFQDNRITLNHEGPASGKSGIDIEGDGSIQATIHYDYSLSKWSIDGSNITNSAQPDSDSDLTNKVYVDTITDNISQNLTDHINKDQAHPQYLRRDDNLSTVNDVQLSRDNLNVYSTTEVDNKVNNSISGALYEDDYQENGGTIPQVNRTNNWVQPQKFGNYNIGLGVNSSNGISIRSTTDPADGENIFSVESSGTNSQFGVTNNFGSWIKDGIRIGSQYNSSMSDAQGGVVIGSPNGDTQGEGTINSQLIYRNGEELDSRYHTQTEISTKLNNLETTLNSDISAVDTKADNIQQEVTNHKNATDPHTQYARNDENLSQLTSASSARTNIDVYSTTEVDNLTSSTQQNLQDHIDATDPHTQYLRKDNTLSGLTDIPGARSTLDVYSTSETNNLLDQKIDVSEKASANGVATLNSNKKVPTNQLPALAITNTFSVANITERDNLISNGTVQEGDVAIVTDDGNGLTRTYILDSNNTWQEIDTPGDVYNVNGFTGNVSLDYSDVNADQQGTAQSIMDNHKNATDPHTQYARNDENLSQLTSASSARTNIDVYSTTEVDNLTSSTQQNLTDHINNDNAHTQYLRKDNTLSGLTDIPGARSTLDVYSTGEVDNAIGNATNSALFDSDLQRNGGLIPETNRINNFNSKQNFQKIEILSNDRTTETDLLFNTNANIGAESSIYNLVKSTSGSSIFAVGLGDVVRNSNITYSFLVSSDLGIFTPNSTGGSQGPDTINVSEIYRNGEELDSRYFTQSQINEKKANEYIEEVSLGSGLTHTITASSLPFNVTELRSVTVDLKVQDIESGSPTENMWIDGTAVLTYGIDTNNSEIVIINEFNQSLNIFIRIIM
ncbi:hypothetical protein PBI_SCTP2_98 [Salicola phage SCTP-2]|nr:hypothetical protein PBI_SCTP2_98 [Salicola phage SCTP-2]